MKAKLKQNAKKKVDTGKLQFTSMPEIFQLDLALSALIEVNFTMKKRKALVNDRVGETSFINRVSIC